MLRYGGFDQLNLFLMQFKCAANMPLQEDSTGSLVMCFNEVLLDIALL